MRRLTIILCALALALSGCHATTGPEYGFGTPGTSSVGPWVGEYVAVDSAGYEFHLVVSPGSSCASYVSGNRIVITSQTCAYNVYGRDMVVDGTMAQSIPVRGDPYAFQLLLSANGDWTALLEVQYGFVFARVEDPAP